MCGKRDGVRAGSVFVTYVPGNFIKNSASLRIYNQGLFEKAPSRQRARQPDWFWTSEMEE